jgi:hypothetical protein
VKSRRDRMVTSLFFLTTLALGCGNRITCCFKGTWMLGETSNMYPQCYIHPCYEECSAPRTIHLVQVSELVSQKIDPSRPTIAKDRRTSSHVGLLLFGLNLKVDEDFFVAMTLRGGRSILSIRLHGRLAYL